MRNKSGLVDRVYGAVRKEVAEIIAEGDKDEVSKILSEGIVSHARNDFVRYLEILAGRTIGCGIACYLSGLTGEAIDHAPYLNEAIPFLFDAVHVSGTKGNLDKIAAGITFTAYMVSYGAQRVKNKRW